MTAAWTHTVPSVALDRAMAAARTQGATARLPPPPRALLDRLRALMVDNAAAVVEELEHESGTEYSAGGVFARIEPRQRQVLVRFLKGGRLPSARRLDGEGEERTVTVSRLDAARTALLKKLVREAVALNLSGMVNI